jgi:hypothetical protein
MKVQYISDQEGNTVSVVIPIHDWEELKKKYKGIEQSLDNTEPTKEDIKENIRRGLQELKLIEENKLKSRPAKEFLDEL